MPGYIVTVKLTRSPLHDPHNKVTGECPALGVMCTDVTGEHHSVVLEATSVEQAAVKARGMFGHVTRVEEIPVVIGEIGARIEDAHDVATALGVPGGSFEWHRLMERITRLAALPGADTTPWPFQVGDVVVIADYPEPVVKHFRIDGLRDGKATLQPCDKLGQPTATYTTLYGLAALRPAT
jgi:hypothetical protein